MNNGQNQRFQTQGYQQQLTLETQFNQNGTQMRQQDRNKNNQQNQRFQSESNQNFNQNNQFNDYQKQTFSTYDQQSKNINQQQNRVDLQSNVLSQNNRIQGSVQNQNQKPYNAAPYRQEQINSYPTQEQTLYVDQPGDISPIEADRPSYANSPNHNVYPNQNTQFDQMYDERVKKSQNQGNNRQQANPNTNIRVQANVNQNMNSPNKKPLKIFDQNTNDNNINKRANNQTGGVRNVQSPSAANQLSLQGFEEQEIYGPGEHNKTILINPDENISIFNDIGNGQNRNNSPNKNNNNNMFFNPNNPNQFFQNEQVKRSSPQYGNTRQGNAGGSYHSNQVGYATQNQAPIGQNQGNLGGRGNNGYASYAVESVYAGSAQQYGQDFGYGSKMQMRYPPIITHFKSKEVNLEREFEVFYKSSNADQDIPTQMIMIKRQVEERIDICMDTLNYIEKEKNQIFNNYDAIYQEYINNEHIFKQEELKQYQSSDQYMEKVIEKIKSQNRQAEINQNQIKTNIKECDLSLLQQQINHNINLDNWILASLEELRRVRYPLAQNFSDHNITCMNTNGFTSIFQKISQFAPQGRFQAIHDQAVFTKSDELERFYEIMNHLFLCQQKLDQIWVEIDSAVYQYADIINKTDQLLVVIVSQQRFYVSVIEESMQSLKDLRSYGNEFQLIQKNSTELTNSIFEKNLLFPFSKYLEQNKKFLKQCEEKKKNQSYSIIRYVTYIREKQQQIHQNQINENVPYILTTPFDWEVIGLSQQSELLNKKLDLFEHVVKSLQTLEYISAKPANMQKSLQEWLVHAQKKQPTQQECKQKFEEVQRNIIELLELRDSLGMHHVKYSCPELFRELQAEYEKLSDQITQIQNLQLQINKSNETPFINKGDHPSYVQPGIQSQQQLSSMNQIMTAGSYSNFPINQTEVNESVKRTKAQPGHSHSPERLYNNYNNNANNNHIYISGGSKSQLSPTKYYSPSKYPYPYDQQHSTQEIERFNYEVTQTRSLLQQNSQKQKRK